MATKEKSIKPYLFTLFVITVLFVTLVKMRQSLLFIEWDRSFYNFALRVSVVDWSLEIWRVITTLGAGVCVYTSFAIVCVISWYKMQKVIRIPHVLFLAAVFALNPLLKNIFAISRPVTIDPLLEEPTSFAFPSGHSANAVYLFFLLPVFMRLVFPNGSSTAQKTQWVLAILGVVLVASSRVMLGVHWFSDVLGGILVGAFGTVFILMLLRKI